MIAMELPLRLDFEFARRDLEKGRAGASRPLCAMRVDLHFDYFPGIRRLNDLALLRRMTFRLRKAKPDPSWQVIVIARVTSHV
jgi:hypothetical protein